MLRTILLLAGLASVLGSRIEAQILYRSIVGNVNDTSSAPIAGARVGRA